MAAAGMIKISALLWQEKLSAWPLLTVLAAPLALAGLALGIGAGHDRIVSLSVAHRLAPIGGLLLLVVPLAGGVLGVGEGILAGAIVGPLAFALIGPRLGHPDTITGAALFGGPDSSGKQVGV